MLVDFLQFMLNLILAGFVLRYVQVRLIDKNSELGKALAFVY